MTYFEPIKYRCNLCKDIIYSRYPGQYITCECGSLSVDQTEFYIRISGNKEDYCEVDVEQG